MTMPGEEAGDESAKDLEKEIKGMERKLKKLEAERPPEEDNGEIEKLKVKVEKEEGELEILMREMKRLQEKRGLSEIALNRATGIAN